MKNLTSCIGILIIAITITIISGCEENMYTFHPKKIEIITNESKNDRCERYGQFFDCQSFEAEIYFTDSIGQEFGIKLKAQLVDPKSYPAHRIPRSYSIRMWEQDSIRFIRETTETVDEIVHSLPETLVIKILKNEKVIFVSKKLPEEKIGNAIVRSSKNNYKQILYGTLL